MNELYKEGEDKVFLSRPLNVFVGCVITKLCLLVSWMVPAVARVHNPMYQTDCQVDTKREKGKVLQRECN